MAWEAWAAIGQLVGAIAVVASLIFLAIQIRQSVKATKATAFQGLVTSIIEVNMRQMENPAILGVIDRAAKGEQLSPEDHRLYVALVLSAARLAQSAHYQSELGLLDESKLESVVYNLVRHLRSDTGQTVWAEFASRSDPRFRAYIESLIDRSDSYEVLLTPKAAKSAPVPQGG